MNSGMLWIFLLLVIGNSFAFTLHGGNETDKLSLLAFRAQITDDPFGALNSWNESFHFCEWSGVTCGRRHQRVVELDLHSYKLVGGLSPSIGNLSFLRLLNLENNSLSSSIPGELGRLFRLQMLRLGNNLFSGEIPANISSCANLIALRLEGNDLAGKIPESLGKLKSLIQLNLSHNSLIDYIQPSLGNLTNLESLDLSSNMLAGRIPQQLVDLTFLAVLNLSYNQLEGSIPQGKQFSTFEHGSYEGNLRLCGLPLKVKCNNGTEGQQLPPSNFEKEDSMFEEGFGWKAVAMGYGCGFVFGVSMGYVVKMVERGGHQNTKRLRRKNAPRNGGRRH